MNAIPICLIIINKQGNFEQLSENIKKNVDFNILSVRFIDNLSNPPTELSDKKLTWSQKLDLQTNQPEFSRNIGKPYQAYYDPKEYGND